MGNKISRNHIPREAKRLSNADLQVLRGVFRQLAKRSPHSTVDKETFLAYFPLHGMLAERLFVAFDKKQNGVVDIDEFLSGVSIVLEGTTEEKADFVYTMFNMDADDGVSKEELNTMLNSVMHSASEVVAALSLPDIRSSSRNSISGVSCEDAAFSVSTKSPLFSKPIRKRRSSSSLFSKGSLSSTPPCTPRSPQTNLVPTTLTMQQATSVDTARTTHSDECMEHRRNVHERQSSGSCTSTNSSRDLGKATNAKQSPNIDIPDKLSLTIRCNSHGGGSPRSMQVLSGGKTCSEMITSDISSPLMIRRANMKTKGSGGNLTVNSVKTMDRYSSVGDVVKDMVEQAFRTYDAAKTGKLNPKEFKVWLAANTSILDSIFSAECFSKHRFQARATATKACDKVGYLYKASTNPVKTWKKRWYTVTYQFLYYYDKKDDRIPSGAIYLPGAYISLLDSWKIKPEMPKSNNKHRRFGLSITSNHNTHTLFCDPDTSEEAQSWIDTITSNNDLHDIHELYLFNIDGNIDKLGSGGFSHVYRALFKYSGERVAVKVIDKRPLDPIEREGMLAEVAILKLTNHINVVGLFEVYDTKNHMYLVMEECEGGELLKYCKNGPLPLTVSVRILYQMFEGLRYLHEIGIVHRDIKPSNLLLSSEDLETADLKIVDFGFSKFVRPSEKLNDTVGTLKYNAPEIINTSVLYGKPVDMWSAGIICYIVLTGQFPFIAQSEEELLNAISRGRFDTNNREYKNLSNDAKNLIRSLLRVSAKTRPTAIDVLEGDFFNTYQSRLLEMEVEQTLANVRL
eukprot:CFRG7143T1